MDAVRRPMAGGEDGRKASAAFAPSPNSIADEVRVFRPGDSAATIALRVRLRKAQTYASARAARTQSETARAILWIVADVASGWTFHPTDDDTLKDVADALVRLVLAASTFERLDGGQ